MKPKIRHIPASEYVTSQWSGGATTQIAIAPTGAQYADRTFLWRVSSATVNLERSDFTPLPDYERFLSVLQGDIRVFHDGGEAIDLTPGRVHRFDGGADTRSEGLCVDFNLMLRKGACSGELHWLHLEQDGSEALSEVLGLPPPAERTRVLYCAQGEGTVTVDGESVSFATGEAVEIANTTETPELRCREGGKFLLCEIVANL